MLENWNTFILPDPVDSSRAELLFAKPANAEEKLMLAVLADAIEHFQEFAFAIDHKGKALFKEAEDWLVEKDSDWFFSFENICETLRLSPSYLRAGLLCWKNAACERRRKVHGRSQAAKRPTASQRPLKKTAAAVLPPSGARRLSSSHRSPARLRSRP